MDERKFTWGGVLRIVFDSLNQSPAHLAEFYIDRDRSLVYRWLRDEAAPTNKLLPDIVRFATECSVVAERVQLKDDMDAYIGSSSLSDQVKNVLTMEDDFEKYLTAVLRIALSERKKKQPAETTSRFVIPIVTIVFALLSALLGGLIWNLLNHLFDWSFYMGGSGNEPTGVLAFVWGLTAGIPVIVLALLSIRMAKPPSTMPIRRDWRLVVTVYSLAAGAAGFIFYNSGFRSFIEGFGYSYGLQEIIIVVVYSAEISILPFLSVFALLRFPIVDVKKLTIVLAAPVLLSVMSVFGTMLVNRPETEIAQLRGFLIGSLLRLSMFVAIRTLLVAPTKEQ